MPHEVLRKQAHRRPRAGCGHPLTRLPVLNHASWSQGIGGYAFRAPRILDSLECVSALVLFQKDVLGSINRKKNKKKNGR